MMRSVEFLIVFSVAAFCFAVVPWGVRADEFMANAHTLQLQFKQRRFITASRQQTIRKFRAIVSLDTFNGKRKLLNHAPEKQGGRIGAVFLKGFYAAETAV